MSTWPEIHADRLQVGVVKLASCSGCQLTLLDGLEGLATRLRWIELRRCNLLTSKPPPRAACYDLVLVEGAVATAAERRLLCSIRRTTPWLVAVGACARGEGVLRGRRLRPVDEVVSVDAWLPGCPPQCSELVTLCGAIARGGLPAPASGTLCLECRSRNVPCLLLIGQPCLGPVTLAGCGAACPGRRIPCEGCRGRSQEANEFEMRRILAEIGLEAGEIERRMRPFARGDL